MDRFNLPPDLAYLSPVIAQLESVAPEDLHEDNDKAINLIESALRGRVRGLPRREADGLLESDRRAFGAWLEIYGDRAESAYFIEGLLLGLGAEFLQAPRPELSPATLHVFMESPPGYDLGPSDGSLLLERDGFTAVVMPIDTSLINPRRLMGAIPADFAGAGAMVDSDVEFGPVRGTKRLHTIAPPDEFKSATYVLEVPGGWVQVTLQGACLDETVFESQFQTLRVEGELSGKVSWGWTILEVVLGLLEDLSRRFRAREPKQ